MKLPKNAKDIAGNKYGMLTAIKPTHSKNGKVVWQFLCDCGNEYSIISTVVKCGSVVSCGCHRRRQQGLGASREYHIWYKMIDRCTNEDAKDYKRYGGRGIKVDSRWMKFENFFSDMGEAPKGRSLDRIDNNGDYSKANCKWSTNAEQHRNKSTNVVITYQGESKILTDWAKSQGLRVDTLWKRLKSQMPLEKALRPRQPKGL
jgi:hypothetical protein